MIDMICTCKFCMEIVVLSIMGYLMLLALTNGYFKLKINGWFITMLIEANSNQIVYKTGIATSKISADSTRC